MTSSKSEARRTPYTIVPVVEGWGEVTAVPILIRRWLAFRRFRNFQVELRGPVRASGEGSLTVEHIEGSDLGVEHYVSLAWLRRPDAILVLLDADKRCPRILGPALLKRARSVVPTGFPIGVVVANREYEAWFLSAFGSPIFRRGLTGEGLSLTQRSIPRDLSDIEAVAGCKSRIADWTGIESYKETIHQAQFTEHLPFSPFMRRKSRSFRKLLDELERLTAAARARRGRK